MEKPILLSADMSCDIGPELQERYHVSLYPLHVLLEGKQYTDGVDIRPEDLYRAPASPSVAEFLGVDELVWRADGTVWKRIRDKLT